MPSLAGEVARRAVFDACVYGTDYVRRHSATRMRSLTKVPLMSLELAAASTVVWYSIS